MVAKTLVLGYGNLDRQDDGVAWHILNTISIHLNIPFGEGEDESGYYPNHSESASDPKTGGSELKKQAEIDSEADSIDLIYSLQLVPEMAEIISEYHKIFFVDVHTGKKSKEIQFVELRGDFQISPFTHHLTPQTLLALSQTLYGRSPIGYFLSVQGYEFGFSNKLSNQTKILADKAAHRLMAWLTDQEDKLPIDKVGNDNRQIPE